MKKIGLIIFWVILASSVVGQQFLWSTSKDTTFTWEEYISLDNVSDKILEFYDHYDFYYDGTGFSKEGFFEFFEDSQSYKKANTARWKALTKKINEINDLTVFAFKDNLGHGSVILVICIIRNNVNLISFSNTLEDDAIITGDYGRKKFASWLKTLLK